MSKFNRNEEWVDTDFVCLGQNINGDNVKVLSVFSTKNSESDYINHTIESLYKIIIGDGFCHYPEDAEDLLPAPCKHFAN